MIEIQHAHHSLILAGLLDGDDLPMLKDALSAYGRQETLHLHLHDIDIEDGKPMAGLTALLKQLLNSEVYVRLDGAPQLLIHNLYRVGFYPHACLQVENMRQDEAYG